MSNKPLVNVDVPIENNLVKKLKPPKFVVYILVFALVVIATLTSVYRKINSYTFDSDNNITTILLLGKGGVGHTAPDLTDTIMNLYLNTNTKKISLISLPRDIWISSTRAKINSSYYWDKEKGGIGFNLPTESVGEVTGIKPNYVVVVDFSMFKEAIDAIGGITVDVENSFVDEKFPIPGRENDLCGGDKTYKCRYETVSFTRGLTYMDGELALKFVRSRNAAGDEGTDLAREKRQQKVISAIKDKVLSTKVLLNPKTIRDLVNVLSSHLETNLSKTSFIAILKELIQYDLSINYLSFPDDLLKVSKNDKKYDFQYVFIPKDGNWAVFQTWLKTKI